MVATKKFSQIAQSAVPPGLSDTVVGVTAGSVDTRFLLSQFATAPQATSNLTFYVATTGSDSNPGTIGSPFLTIQHAIDVVASFDYQNIYVATINVAAGTYDCSFNGLLLRPLINGVGPTFQNGFNQSIETSATIVGVGSTTCTIILGAESVVAWGPESMWGLSGFQWDFGRVSFVQALTAWNGATLYITGSHQQKDSSNGKSGQVLGAWGGGTVNFQATWTFTDNFNTFLFGGSNGVINVNGSAHLIFPAGKSWGFFWADLQTGPMYITYGPGSTTNPASFTAPKYIISGGPINIQTPDGTFDNFPGTYGNGDVDAMSFVNNTATFGGPILPKNAGSPAAATTVRDTIWYWKDTTNGPRYFVINDNNVIHVRQIGRNINTQTGNYTLHLYDQDGRVEMNVAGANTLTVPLNASVAFPIGTEIKITQIGAGATTITAIGGVTGDNFGALSQWQTVTLYKRAADEWVQTGA